VSVPATVLPETHRQQVADQAALRVIITYKILKGFLTVAAGVVIGGALIFGFGPGLQAHAARIQLHATGAWALYLAELLSKFTTPRWLRWSAVALELDGAVCFVEAWALREGHAWGPWLVVVITALFLPTEVYELFRHPRISRGLILLANVAILVFLIWYARRHGAQRARMKAAQAAATPPGL
jgi:uncharacterized membrane protein (DUF2068 family)